MVKLKKKQIRQMANQHGIMLGNKDNPLGPSFKQLRAFATSIQKCSVQETPTPERDLVVGVVPLLQPSEGERQAALRFLECCEAGQDFDVPMAMMKRLEQLGLVTRLNGRRYQGTDKLEVLKKAVLTRKPSPKSAPSPRKLCPVFVPDSNHGLRGDPDDSAGVMRSGNY